MRAAGSRRGGDPLNEADELGNARVDPKLTWVDGELAMASRTVIVTAERIVDTETFRAAPERTSIPGYAVDHVVRAPRGAWPTAMLPDYQHDGAYVAAAKDSAGLATMLAELTR